MHAFEMELAAFLNHLFLSFTYLDYLLDLADVVRIRFDYYFVRTHFDYYFVHIHLNGIKKIDEIYIDLII